MIRRWAALLLAMIIAISFPMFVQAQEAEETVVASGSCGKGSFCHKAVVGVLGDIYLWRIFT